MKLTQKNKDELIRTGAEYLMRGFSVIPVMGKKPCVDWKKFQEKAMTVIEFQSIFERCSPTGIAIITGKVSGIIVVDVDSEEANTKLNLSKTPTVKTSRGFHYYFKYPDIKVVTSSNHLEKVDIRSDGGFIVAPPSIHESGFKYEWITGLDETELAEFPFEKFKAKQTIPVTNGKDWEPIFSGTREGNRNTTTAQIAGKLLSLMPSNEWERTTWPLLKALNRLNVPPLDENELRATFNSIAKINLKSSEGQNLSTQEIKIISIKDLFSMEQEKETFLIEKLLTNNGINVMSGQPHAGKSWIMLEMAKSVAKGEKLFGKYDTLQGSVMIIDGESGEQELKRRMLKMHFDETLPIYITSRDGIKIDNKETLKHLISKAKELDIRLVILDPFSAIHSKTENNAEDMQIVMESMESFTKEGITVLFLHHHRKESGFSPSSASQNLRGSSVILSRVDSQSVISGKGDAGTTTRIRYSQEKLRNGKKEKPFELFLEEDELGVYIKHAGEIKVENSKMDKAIETIQKLLAIDGKTKEEVCDLLKKEDVQERTTSTALRKLENSGAIKKTKKGKKNFYIIAVKS